MSYLYGATDEKFVRRALDFSHQETLSPLSFYQFHQHSVLQGKALFNKNEVPKQFKITPDTLLVLAATVVDRIPLPSVFSWTNVDVCKWLRQYGYPNYQRTFRQNLIHGRSLLLLDVDALSAMNIKNFDDIRHIAYGIRCLFHFELTTFARSISLPPEFYNELYKLFRVKSGRQFELTRRSDLYKKMQLIREYPMNITHWEKLENWLAVKPDPVSLELFGGFRRRNLYKCKKQKLHPTPHKQILQCVCLAPCECYWTPKCIKSPWRLSCLPTNPNRHIILKEKCEKCLPPCTCHWFSMKIKSSGKILSCLQNAFPEKYGLLEKNRSYSVG